MNRILVFVAPALLLLPHLASAQTPLDPPPVAIARQSLAVLKQQLQVLNNIQAIEQAQLNRPTAAAALAYAHQQTQAQLEAATAAGAAK